MIAELHVIDGVPSIVFAQAAYTIEVYELCQPARRLSIVNVARSHEHMLTLRDDCVSLWRSLFA